MSAAVPLEEKPSKAFATVNGVLWEQVPGDLYIPPEALKVVLEQFEGPLDLLLYLIRKQKIDIAELPILKITHQYMQYIQAMELLEWDLAAEYLVMAALLAEIKSRMLLPVTVSEAEEEADPRMTLIRRLQAYQIYQEASAQIDQLPRQQRDHFAVQLPVNKDLLQSLNVTQERQANIDDLAQAMQQILTRVKHFEHHQVQRSSITIRDKMAELLHRLSVTPNLAFHQCFDMEEGREGVVMTFLAMLALIKERSLRCLQLAPLDTIYLSLYEA